MEADLGDIAALALSHDPLAARAAAEAHLRAHGPCADAEAVLAFTQVLTCEFDAALAWLPEPGDPITRQVADFVSAVCLAHQPTYEDEGPVSSAYLGLGAFVTVETAMSAGQITRAERLAVAQAGALADFGDGTYWAWNQVALARSLAFQGRVTEAREQIDLVLADGRSDAWPAVDRIARGVRAFVAAHEGEPGRAAAFADGLADELPEPRTYLESAAFVLAAFAKQAEGRVEAVESLLLHGGGGAYLPRYQIVDRTYAYEILVEATIARGDAGGARAWVELAEALPVDAHDMASAALARSRARLALALDDPETGARESTLSQQRAALVGGSLEVLRSQLLNAAASRAQGTGPVDVEGLEEVARLAAGTGARAVREWAARELALRGRRVRNVLGQGWDSLTDRQKLVGLLAAQGLRNREIGARLFVSERTVEGHVASVLEALGAPSRVGIGQHLPASERTGRSGHLDLTPRQRSVADLVAEGRSNAAIAAVLGISEKTVEKHVSDLFDRLKVQSRAGIAALVRDG
ncbi:DNA-binding NarL/FixJ family response regulator [Marmoricola sp. OAE513]|uniref:helix-turn-helix transcriptional regulator n=1 Tax=Marmoricola sp. OAE513 TaxID=2817894 RepID=UPI001AE9B314